jgi:hypothetical protein
MSKKLSGNTLWESSKMMLPEHRKALYQYKQSLQVRSKIELDEQEQEEINRALQQSLQQRAPLIIYMYAHYEQLRMVGRVERIDALLQRFKLNGQWFSLADIERVEHC